MRTGDSSSANHWILPRLLTARSLPALTLSVFVLAAVFAPLITRYDPNAQLDVATLRNVAPNAQHWLGTDQFSRDVFSRAIFGARTSLVIGATGALLATLVATIWGAAAGILRDTVGNSMMAVADLFRALPRKIVLLVCVMFIPHPTISMLAVIMGITSWTAMSQVIFVQTRSQISREYIASARALGVPSGRIMWQHLLPHLVSPVGAASTVLLADILAMEAGLSFLGLGVRPPTASWGSMLQDGVPWLASAWWVAATPAVLLVVVVLAISRVADQVQEHVLAGR